MYQILKKKVLNSYVNTAFIQAVPSIFLISSTESLDISNCEIILGRLSSIKFSNLFNLKNLKFPLVMKILKDIRLIYQFLNNELILLVFNNFYFLDPKKAVTCLNVLINFFAIFRNFLPIFFFHFLETVLFS
jgi:hypothetical protein